MSQTIGEMIDVAVQCYDQGDLLIVNGDSWRLWEGDLNDLEVGVITYRREEIIDLIASKLFFKGKTKRLISPVVYKRALKLFKIIHINTDPSYRRRYLDQERGSIRFVKGKKKRG